MTAVSSNGWPERPTCHDDNSPNLPSGWALVWKEPHVDLVYGSVEGFRRCSYCGSVHPGDLFDALEAGVATLHGADWKYGWPHKFYVDGLPNLFQGTECKVGSRTQNGITTPIMGTPSKTAFAKFYNAHLTDLGYDPDNLARLCQLLELHGGIRFVPYTRDDGVRDLRYVAPRHGYQR